MSTDRELLEMAAKAAGLDGTYCELVGGVPALYVKTDSLGMWAPLEDDSDALRLAVKLRISIDMDEQYVFGVRDRESGLGMCECWNDDPHAATRRAIVRAAAEIGRSMA